MPGHRSLSVSRRPVLIVAGALALVLVAVAWLLLKPSTPDSEPKPQNSPKPRPAVSGSGAFDFAAAGAKAVGQGDKTHAYRVAVEKGTTVAVKTFAADVEGILADERGWDGKFQRVAANGKFTFTVYLATAATVEKMCAVGGLHTGGKESCRIAGQLLINLDQWWDEGLRPYLLNHALGHQLGFGHEACPGAGQPAPVMQQQTQDLSGCMPYGWPKKEGSRYTGPAIP